MRYEPIKIRLEEPRTFDGKELTHISMRQPTANDVILSQHAVASIGAQGSQDAEQEAHLFANLTDTSRALIGSLSVYDYTQLAKAYECFFSANAKVCRRMCLTLSKFTGGTSFRDISLMPISEIYEWLREAEEMMVESKDGE